MYRLWASLRLGHLREWVEGWLPNSVFSLGNGLSSVEAWFSTALDIEEVLAGIGGDQLHVMVADVIKSFDTVDRSILDCALGRLGLPDWFRKAYFSFHSQVRLLFELAAGLGEPWCKDGGIPQGCPLSMVFIVALYVPWCRHLEALPDVNPQLYADNLECSAERPGALFDSARFTARSVRAVGQDVSLGECVLLSTAKSVWNAMKLGDNSGDGGFWKVQLDVRDLGGHLDFTWRARAVSLSKRVGDATVGVAAVGALPLGFQVKLGLVRGKYPAARRMRERRLRRWARHEKLSVQMALSECKRHSSRGQRKDRAGGEVRVEPHGGVPEAPLPQGGSRPPCLGVPRGPHVGLERHFLEHMADICPLRTPCGSWTSRLPSR